jgi:nucleoside-diphosphate-sugar epimerase
MHVIVGAGSIGTSTARQLAAAGEKVRIVTRSGSGPEDHNIERVAADATDADALSRLAEGAVAIYNCANPQYHRWPVDWPPLAAAILAAAEHSGAVLAVTGNLYVYGPVDRPMTADLPLAAPTVKGKVRVRMWNDAMAAHRAGRVRVFEARASDFIGLKNSILEMALPAMRAGKTVRLPSPLDVPHTFTYVEDVARTLVALARDERAWGRAWHVPSAEPMTLREMIGRAANAAGLPVPKVAKYPDWLVRANALVNPFTREFLEMRYQFTRPYVLDSSETSATFGLRPTPVDQALRETLAAPRPQSPAA